MNDYAIPQEWLDVLSEVQVMYPRAVIAGGALRDLFNGKPIKDVDVFIPCVLEGKYLGNELEMFQGMFPRARECQPDVCTEYKVADNPFALDNRGIYGVINLDMQDYNYDLILCSDKAADVSSFDINICQISFDGTDVHMTDQYLRGIKDKVIRVTNDKGENRTKKRLKRMQDKFPEFAIQTELRVV